MPFVKTGGSFIAYKGNADAEIEEGRNAVKILGGEIGRIKSAELSDGSERKIIEIVKKTKTPVLYPRGNGKERKKPL